LLAEVEQVEDEEEEKEKQLEEAQIGEDEGQSLLTGVKEEEENEGNEEEDNEGVGEKGRDEGREEGRDGNEEEESPPSVKLEFIPVLLLDPNEEEDKSSKNNAYQIAEENEEKGEEKEEEENKNKEEPTKLIEKTKRNNQKETLNAPENAQLEQILQKLLLQKEGEDGEKDGKGVKTLSDRQIARLVKFVKQLQNLVEEGIERRGELWKKFLKDFQKNF